MKDAGRPVGTFLMRVYKNGTLVEVWEDRNLIVNWTRDSFARLLSGTFDGANLQITHIHIGTNGDYPVGGDTQITDPYVKEVSVTHPDIGKAKIQWSLDYTECNGMAIHEFGLVTVNGSLFARKVRESPLHKDADISIEGEWGVDF
jgi:hypothetical protein